jgi:DNA mismatch repair protein MutS2
LRDAVWQFLRRHPRAGAYRIGKYGEGDAGVTVVTLK